MTNNALLVFCILMTPLWLYIVFDSTGRLMGFWQ